MFNMSQIINLAPKFPKFWDQNLEKITFFRKIFFKSIFYKNRNVTVMIRYNTVYKKIFDERIF